MPRQHLLLRFRSFDIIGMKNHWLDAKALVHFLPRENMSIRIQQFIQPAKRLAVFNLHQRSDLIIKCQLIHAPLSDMRNSVLEYFLYQWGGSCHKETSVDLEANR